LWNVATKEVAILGDGYGCVAFSPDGNIIASCSLAGWPGICLWDVAGQSEIAVLKGHTESVGSVAFSPDGKMLASSGYYEGTVCLWDVAGKSEITVLKGIGPVAFSPDGKILASGSRDGSILLWGEIPTSMEPKGKKFLTWGETKRTALLQNYPNPFNPETWIPFALHKATEVEIRIYDVSGNLIRTLKLGTKSPGAYFSKKQAAYWDGKNDAGETVGSGVYFYQVRVGDKIFVRKAMLLK